MRTVYCTSFPARTTKEDLRGLFSRYGEIECLWINNSERAYVCFADVRCAQNAIDSLNNEKFEGRKLRVEWAMSDCHRRHAGEEPKRSPSANLFVFNFDETRTTKRDLLRHFEPYGRVRKVTIRGENAFVAFESERDAERALENTHNRYFDGRLLRVDYSSGPYQRSPPQPRRESPDYSRYDFPSSSSSALRSPPQPRHWSPDYNRYNPPPSYSWRARRSRSPVYNRNDRHSYSRASSSVHRRYPSRSNARGSRN